MYIIMAILGFSLLVIVHELGHFIMAKVNGIKVEEFSIGMGPEILSKKGSETQYSLRLFPIGGYVKMLGEEEASDDERSFSSKSPLRRICVIIAGVTMNVIFAIIAFTIIISNRGYTDPVISKLVDNSAAVEAGLEVGDRILSIDGSKVFTTTDISMGIQMAKGDSVDLVVNRNGKKENITVTPRLVEENGSQIYQIGFYYTPVENPTIIQSIKESFNETISLVTQTYKSLVMMVTGKVNFKTDVGGPVTIIKMSTQVAKNGLLSLTYFLGFLSINLAVFNLLPFPALDGGWTVILLIELITRRKVPDKIVGAVNYVGFMVLIGFMIVVTLKDILFPISL